MWMLGAKIRHFSDLSIVTPINLFKIGMNPSLSPPIVALLCQFLPKIFGYLPKNYYLCIRI